MLDGFEKWRVRGGGGDRASGTAATNVARQVRLVQGKSRGSMLFLIVNDGVRHERKRDERRPPRRVGNRDD